MEIEYCIYVVQFLVILCSVYIITSWTASILVVEYLSAAPMFREITLTNYSHDLNIFCQEISCPGHDNSLHFFFLSLNFARPIGVCMVLGLLPVGLGHVLV